MEEPKFIMKINLRIVLIDRRMIYENVLQNGQTSPLIKNTLYHHFGSEFIAFETDHSKFLAVFDAFIVER